MNNQILRMILVAAGFFLLATAMAAQAQLSVEPITWDVVGLDSNRPVTEGPELFPVGARVCSDTGTGTDDVQVVFTWDGNDSDAGTVIDWVDTRPGSDTVLDFGPLGAAECVDAYFEIKVERGFGAFEVSRPYRITATAGSDSATTPIPRQIYVERLVSQNRNVTQTIRSGQLADESDWEFLGGGATLALEVGETYFIELTTETATSYEQIESFITLSNTIFQVLSVETDYSTRNFAPPIPDPNPSLYGDGCTWDPDPDSPNYLSCQDTGKVGGTVTTVYEIKIIASGGNNVTLEALIYDFSGSSFHYNTDFVRAPGELAAFEPVAPDFGKRFIPDSIGADGISTVRFTISNPNPVDVTGYSFTDSLPSGMQVAATPNASNTCGGTLTAVAAASDIVLTGGSLAANSSCSILVDVTVPFDTGVMYPLNLTNNVDLLVGDPNDPEFTVPASADLEVTEFPPPPQICTPDPLAAWTSFDNAASPAATADPESRFPAAAGGAGLTFSLATINSQSVWNAQAVTTGQDLAAARSSNAYYEFELNTEGLTTLDFALEAFRQNGNAPASLTLLWGTDASSLTQSTTLTPVPTRNNAVGFRNLRASSLGGLDDGSGDGITVFRVYAYGATNTNQAVSILNVLISSGETCVDSDPATAPNPPQVIKEFQNPPGTAVSTAGLGQQLTLAFTVTNPNAADTLSGVSLVDALPPGLEIVANTFVNNCTGGTWSESPTGVLALEDASLTVDASCTLSVDVRTTSVGNLINLSDPVDANETLPGNSAQDELTVAPPPETPSILKFFEPNPLLDPAGTTRLVFRITNNDDSLAISDVAFTDTLPAGLVFDGVGSTDTNSNCGSPMVSTSGLDTLAFDGGTIAAGTVCEVGVDVVLTDTSVTLPAQFLNTSGNVSHIFNGAVLEGNQASAPLLVDLPIPGIALIEQVGLSNAVDGVWTDYRAVALGTDVYYKYTIENVGETTLSNISLTDPNPALDVTGCVWTDTAGNALPGNFTLPVASFADPEAHIAICIVGAETIVQASESTTLATVIADAPAPIGGTVQDADSATVAGAALTLAKSGTFNDGGDGVADAGDIISYSFLVSNAGNVTLSNIAVTDPLSGLSAITCPSGNPIPGLAVSTSETCTASYPLSQADVDVGVVNNIATAAGNDPGGNPVSDMDSHSLSLPGGPVIALAKNLDSVTTDLGGGVFDIALEFVVENLGPVTLANVQVTDNLDATFPPPATYVIQQGPSTTGSLTANASFNGSGDQNLLDAGASSLAIGAAATVSVTVRLTLNNASSPFFNTATASGESPAGGISLDVSDNGVDPDPNGNGDPGDAGEDDPTRIDVAAPALALVKTGTFNDENSDTFAQVGETIDYSFEVTNTGNVTLANVSVTDPLAGLSAIICPGGNPIPGLVRNASVTCTASLPLTQSMIDAGQVSNQATATGTDPSEQPVTDISDDDSPLEDQPTVTPLGPDPRIAIVKTGTFNDENSDTFAQVGETISYAFTVSNTGNVSLTNITVNDPLLTVNGGPLASLSVGASDSTTFSGSYTLTQDDIDAGRVSNQATATGRNPSDDPVMDDSDDDSPLEDDPTITALQPPLQQPPALPVPVAGFWNILLMMFGMLAIAGAVMSLRGGRVS